MFKDKTGKVLINIIIGTALLGGLVTAVTAKTTDVMPTARDAKRSSDTYQITLALAIYYDDHNSYPVYLENNPRESWELLKGALESDYMQEVPVDPAEDQGYYYRYWSDGQVAKIFYFSEVDNKFKERWSY